MPRSNREEWQDSGNRCLKVSLIKFSFVLARKITIQAAIGAKACAVKFLHVTVAAANLWDEVKCCVLVSIRAKIYNLPVSSTGWEEECKSPEWCSWILKSKAEEQKCRLVQGYPCLSKLKEDQLQTENGWRGNEKDVYPPSNHQGVLLKR